MPRNNQQEELNDHGVMSDREPWNAIRYLDPELDRRGRDITATIAVLALVCMVSVVCVLLHLRGL